MDDDKIDPEYLKGFNEGFLFKQHESELADLFKNIEGDSNHMQGFQAGMREMGKKKEKDFLPKWLSTKSQITSPNKNLDKGDLDKND